MCAALVAVTLAYLLELLVHGLVSAAYPYDLNYGEGFVVNDALRLVRGEPLWTDVNQFPMVRSPYPPGYLAVVGILTAPWPSLLPARLISLAAALCIGVLLFHHARRSGVPIPVAVAAAGVWLGSTFVYQWAPLARVDLLGLALSLAALVTVGGGTSGRRLAGAALLCSLALLTKQTYLAAPIAIGACLWMRRDPRAPWFAVGVAGPVVLVTAALSAATEGRYLQHVWFGNAANPFNPGKLLELGSLFAGLNAPGLLLTAIGLAWVWRAHGPRAEVLYVPMALATVVTIGNAAGDVNYFLEPTVAIALAVPWAWHIAESQRRAVALVLLLQLLLLIHLPNGFMSRIPDGPAKGATPVAEDVQVGDQVLNFVRAAGDRALVEPAGLAVVARVPVWVQPVDLHGDQRLGRWSPELLVRSLDEQWWDVVVLDYQFLPQPAMDALHRAYELVWSKGSPNGLSYFVYRPIR